MILQTFFILSVGAVTIVVVVGLALVVALFCTFCKAEKALLCIELKYSFV